MANPTCPTNCDSDLPVLSFSECNPQVQESEIRRLFFAKINAAPFTNWLNASEWLLRLSNTDTTSDDTIRVFDVIADLPAGSQVTKDISKRRKLTITKDRTLPFTIDDVSQANYDAARVLECNAQYKWWWETNGGYMYGGNNGEKANVDLGLVLARGADATEEIQGQLTWRAKFMPERGLSPIFEGNSTSTPTTFDTSFDFTSSTSDNDTDSGVGATATATDADLGFEFNAIDGPTGTPASMNINVSSVLQLVVDFPTDYVGQSFRFTDTAGVEHTGIFINGDRNF